MSAGPPATVASGVHPGPGLTPSPEFTAGLAARFAETALLNVVTEFPNKLDHVLSGAQDLATPRALHPVFYGSYDWHSAVHMHWLLVRLLRLGPAPDRAARIGLHFDGHFSAVNMDLECQYLERPHARSFERPYGWAWLMKLATELELLARALPAARAWLRALTPLTEILVQRMPGFLAEARYPVRAGTHANSAFALEFALEYAECGNHAGLAESIRQKAQAWFGDDRAYPARFEPSATDFLSGGLQEATLMHRVLDASAFAAWWSRFRPPRAELSGWLVPVGVADRSDAQWVHLDGLNLSRAWCLRRLARALPDAPGAGFAEAALAHLQASLAQATDGAYVGTHWLASFALLATTG